MKPLLISSSICSLMFFVGCGTNAKTSVADSLSSKLVTKLTTGASTAIRLGGRFALAESAAEYDVQALAEAAEADVVDSSDGFARARELDTGEAGDDSGLGAAGPEFIQAIVERLDDPTYFADTNSPPSAEDMVAIAGEVVEVVVEEIASVSLSDEEKEALLGDVAEVIPMALDDAGLTDAQIVEFSDDLNRVAIENLTEVGFDASEIIAIVSEITEGAALGFAEAEMAADLADDYMAALAAGIASEFVELEFTTDEITAGMGEVLQGAAEESECLGLNDSSGEASAFMQELLESVDAVVDIDEAAIADDIEAGLVESGMSATDAASVEDAVDTYNPDTSAPDTTAISPEVTPPSEET